MITVPYCRAGARTLLLLAFTLAMPALAEEEADLRYVQLEPTFVTNFGYDGSGRLYYLKADVSLKVSSQEAEMALQYHAPMLRDAIVALLSRASEEAVVSGAGRNELRAEAISELKSLMKSEEGESYIEDLLFTNFVVQR